MNLSRAVVCLILIFFCCTTVITSCSTRPRKVLSEKKMVDVFQDMLIADAIFRNNRDDFKQTQDKDALIKGILEKHDITQEDLNFSIGWYADNIDLYTQIQDTVSAKLQKKSDAMSKLETEMFTFKLAGFNVALPEHYVLDVNSPTFRFRIDSNQLRTFEKEKFRFSFSTTGIDTSSHRIETRIYYKYKDTTVIEKRKISENKYYEFIKPTIEDSLLNDISAYVHISRATNKMPKVYLNNIRNKDVNWVQETDSLILEEVEEILPDPSVF